MNTRLRNKPWVKEWYQASETEEEPPPLNGWKAREEVSHTDNMPKLSMGTIIDEAGKKLADDINASIIAKITREAKVDEGPYRHLRRMTDEEERQASTIILIDSLSNDLLRHAEMIKSLITDSQKLRVLEWLLADVECLKTTLKEKKND